MLDKNLTSCRDHMMTISDHFVTGEKATAEERQSTFTDMMKLALETAIK